MGPLGFQPQAFTDTRACWSTDGKRFKRHRWDGAKACLQCGKTEKQLRRAADELMRWYKERERDDAGRERMKRGAE